MEENNGKVKRLQFWAVLLIIIGGVSAFVMPEHSLESFYSLLKDVVSLLIMQ